MPVSFLCKLTKNLTSHLTHILCAVLPKINSADVEILRSFLCILYLLENWEVLYGAGFSVLCKVRFPQEYCMYCKESWQSTAQKRQVRQCFPVSEEVCC